MFWVLVLMVPSALIIGVLAGMREGSKMDRSLSTVSIVSTATPEYVSGVIFIAVFASSAFGLKWFKGSATSAMDTVSLAWLEDAVGRRGIVDTAGFDLGFPIIANKPTACA